MGTATSMLYSGAVEAAAGSVVNGAVSSVTNTYKMQEGVDVALYSLQQVIIKIQCAINAARRRRITDPQLLEWLASLIDAFYLGNYYYRTFQNWNSQPPMIASEGTSNLAISPSYHAAKRRRTIKTLLFGDEELSKLNDTLKKLKSIDISVFILMVNAYPEWPIRIYLYMDHNRLFSRDKERDQVMKFLFEPSIAGENNVDVLPIIGSGGAGKTSLALHCFYDPKVQNHFSLKIYDQYSSYSYPSAIDARISEQILVQYNIADITNNDESTLLAMLKQKLSSERFLLVMDEVWLEDSMAWRALCDCLRCGKKGSKVIFIASSNIYNYYKKIMNAGAVKPIVLDGFSEDDYMLFFKEHAFGSADPEDYPELEKIGKEIATEMNGSIWAAKIFGELLRDNLNASFWSNFLQKGLLNSELSWQSKDLFEVIRNIPWVLPKRLPAVNVVGITRLPGNKPLSHELKSFRELMVLGPNHCMPVNKRGEILLEFLLTKHVFLNKCTAIKAILYFD